MRANALPRALLKMLALGAAALMADAPRVNTYIRKIDKKYVNRGFPYPWYCAEAGWFIRVNRYMLGKRPL